MTIEERVAALEAKFAVSTLADEPQGYYTSVFSGEQIDQAVGDVLEGNFVVLSSTSGSSKKFKLTVNDSGTVSATEVTSA